jgi:hypothetical protein
MKAANIAIITGASSGLGAEFARQLDARAHVDEFWLIARNEEKLSSVAKSLHTPTRCISADLSKPEEIDAIKVQLEEHQANISYLINCAGFGRFGSWEDISLEDAQAMIDLDCRALVCLTQACLPYLGRGSHLIEVASAAGFVPLPYLNVYAAAKAFVLRYTRGLRYELHGRNIATTALCPTWVKTGFEQQARISKNAQAVNHLFFEQKPKTVVSRALLANRLHFAVACCSLPAFALRLVGKIVPSGITMAGWNIIRRL